MEKQSSQEHSITENKGDTFSRAVRPNLAAMQLQLLPHVRIDMPYFRRLATLPKKIMVLGRTLTVDHPCHNLTAHADLQDVLRDILSRLSLKEVVRMRVLSREWGRLRICHPDLVFTKDTFGINTATNIDQASKTVKELLRIRAEKLELLTRKFIDNVDNVLLPLWSSNTTTTTTVDKFVVKFGLRRKHKYCIDRWISFSTTLRAKHIALDFTPDVTCVGPGSDKYMYVFTLWDLSGPYGSCIKSLDLGYLCLELPLSFCGITNLKRLTLDMVSISEGDLQRLLLGCALLESLNIESCSSFSSLRIQEELSRLQYLRVRYCDLKIIELHAPNLSKYEFDDYLVQTVLSDSSKLSEAIFVSNLRLIDGYETYDDVLDYIFTELPTALPCVQTLLLLLTSCQVQRFCNTRDSFTCLRHLNMNLDIFQYSADDSWVMGFVNFLQLAPLLEELEVHMDCERYCSSEPRTVTAAQGPLHRHLRSVYMSGFCDVSGLAELALHILVNATVLERMVLDPVAGMKEDLNTKHFYSVSKGGSSEQFVLPTEEAAYCINEKRMFAKHNLDREEFRHILTIL